MSGRTLKALAKKINIDPRVLQATVGEYNACYDERHDFVSSKDRKYLHLIRIPNFYAVKLVQKALISDSGIRINHKTEALIKKGDFLRSSWAGFPIGSV